MRASGARAIARGAQARRGTVGRNGQVDLSGCAHSSAHAARVGARSRVRAQCGLDAQPVAYDQTAVVANFRCARPHLWRFP